MSRPQASENDRIVEGTVRIVKGYVAGNKLPPEALAALITTVSRALRSAPDYEIEPVVPQVAVAQDAFVGSDRPRKQAAPRALTRKEIADSIHETFLVCFEDNKPYRMLSRHLRLFGLTPDAYRAKWGLPDDYPMMPAFDMKHRAELARQRRLWQYDRSTAKPRKTYVLKAKASAQGDGTPAKPKASSPDRIRGESRQLVHHPSLPYRPTPEQFQASIGDKFLVSFEDGMPYRMLKRHLTKRGLTPDAYRAKWGLPADYPMVAPFYTRKRSALAKRTKLGHHDRSTAKPDTKDPEPKGSGEWHRHVAPAQGVSAV